MKIAIQRACCLAVLAAAVLSATPAEATLLVHEPFAYADGDLNGQGATNTFGMTGTWTTNDVNGNPARVHSYSTEGLQSGIKVSSNAFNTFDGTVANLPTSGGYAGVAPPDVPGATGNTTDHMEFSRPLDPSVTATFTDGSTTWASFVYARGFSANATAAKLAIGAGFLNGERGHTATGEAIGGGGGVGSSSNNNTFKLYPQFWDEVTTGSGSFQNFDHNGLQANSGSTANNVTEFFTRYTVDGLLEAVPNVIVMKIDWSDTGFDVISLAVFSQNDILSEANFDALVLANSTTSAGWTTQADLDQSQFDTLSIAGARYFVDEIRIGTSFDSIVGASVTAVPEPGTFILAGCGLLGLVGLAVRRRRRN